MLASIAHLRLLRTIGLLMILTASACDGGQATGPAGSDGSDGDFDVNKTSLGLVEDRQVRVTPWSSVGESKPGNPKSVNLLDGFAGGGGPFASIRNHCATAANKITGGDLLLQPSNASSAWWGACAVNAPESVLGNGQALAVAVAHGCVGSYALSIAEANSTYYFTQAGVFTAKPPEDAGRVIYTVDPSSSSDRASWALLAADSFRGSVTAGSLLLGTPGCTPADLRVTYSNNGNPKTVDWGEQVAAHLSESLANSVEAARKAAKYLHAAAQAKNATKGDRAKYRSIAWRDPYDSLLRASSAYVRVPQALFNTKNDQGTVTTPGTYPVVTSFLVTDEHERAEDLLRTYRVDPRTVGARSIETVANEIKARMDSDYRGAFTNLPFTGTAFLQQLGITSDDLRRAMNRLIQEQAVLGRPWRAYTTNGTSKLSGLEKTSEPASPYYLYNITEGAMTPEVWDGNTPTADYSRRGVFHAMDYALYNLRLMSEKTDYSAYSAKARRLVTSARSFARQYVQGHLTVASCDSACGGTDTTTTNNGTLHSVIVRVVGAEQAPLGASATAAEITAAKNALAQEYDIWFGEEGLQCAIEGVNPLGKPCDPADYQFRETLTYVASATAMVRYPYFEITSAQIPNGMNALPNPLAIGARLYVTKRVASANPADPKSRNVAVGGFVLYTPPTTGFDHRLIPMSTGLADALASTLAVDPLAADETAQFCGNTNLPRSIKLGLESELLQSRGNVQDNQVEESWAYYLGLAKTAAEEADLIGNDLVTQGLAMDTRAEEARNELEDLCGGTVNVGDLQAKICGTASSTPGSCDLMKYLQSTSSEANPDIASLKQCLGVNEIASATLGPYGVCTWQYSNLGPCECPKTGAGATGCPGRIPSPEEHTAWLNKDKVYFSGCYAPIFEKQYNNAGKSLKDFTPADCAKLFVPPVGGGAFPAGFTFQVLNNKLDLTSPIGDREDPPKYDCQYLAGLRAKDKAALETELNELGKGRNLDVPLEAFKQAASRLKVRRSDLNFVSVTLDDGDWGMKVTGVADDPYGANGTFPCAPNPKLEANYCQGEKASSLLCGMDCGAGASTTSARIELMQSAGERLAGAVEFMRAVTGTGMEGIEVALGHDNSLAASGGFDFNRFAVKPEGGSPETAEIETLVTRVRKRTMSSSSECDVIKADREGVSSGTDYCVGSGTGSSENPDLDYWRFRHATWIEKKDAKKKAVSIREVCIPGSQEQWSAFRYPFTVDDAHPLTLPGPKHFPPPCSPDLTTGSYMPFFDAGGLVSWPSMGKTQVSRFWASELDPLLRKGLAGSRTKELDIIGPKTNVIAVGTGVERSPNSLSNYTYQNMLDAFELACMATSPSYANVECGRLDDDFKGLGDIAKMKGTLNCRSKGIARLMDSMMLQDVPQPLITALQQQSSAALYPTFQGQYATTVAKLYNAIIAIGTSYKALSSSMGAMGPIFESAEAQIQSINYKKDANVEQAVMQIELASNECARARQQIAVSAARGALSGAAAGNAAWGSVWGTLSFGGSAALGAATGAGIETAGASIDASAACDARDIQKKHTTIINDLTNKAANADIVVVIQSTVMALNDIHGSMETASDSMRTAYSDAQAALAELAAQRKAAQRAAANVLMLDNDDAGHEFAVNTAMRARMNTLRVQYERAHDYAIRMAYLARRAVEQKIGIELNDLGDDVGWVAAPRSWADSICSLSGIDYNKIRESKAVAGEEPYHYADEYVGNYVQRLEEFITAYENTYVSQTGRDTALISVRDELLKVRNNACEIDGVNELLQSAEALNVAPAGMEEDEAREYEPEVVWESPTNAAGTFVSASPVMDDSPFIPYRKDAAGAMIPAVGPGIGLDSPAWGKHGNVVRAVRLSPTVDTQALGSDATNAPTQPPAGMVYWYRADACGLSPTSACSDLSGNGRHTPGATGTVTVVPSGIGGRPHLAFAQGARVMNSANTLPEYNEYTLGAVVRASTTNHSYLWDTGAMVRADGRSGNFYLFMNSAWIGVGSDQDIRSNAGPFIGLYVGAEIAPPNRVVEGDIVTVRGGAQGLEVYVNGSLRAKNSRPATAHNLRGSLCNALGASMEWAESVAYGKRLSDPDLEVLHAYLAGRYGKSRQGPISWFSADVMQDLRTTGASPTTGYTVAGSLSTSPLVDAATGRLLPNNGSPATIVTQPLVPFSGGRYALRFDPNQSVFTNSLSYTEERIASVTTRIEDGANREFAATVVANADPGGVSRLWATGFWSPTNVQTGRLMLDVDCASGRVQITNSQQGAARGTGPGAITCGVPFVATLRVSESRNTTDLFVNGRLVFSEAGTVRSNGVISYGGTNGGYLKGYLADMQFNMNNMSDADLVTLHAQLGAKFAIATSGTGDGSSIASGSPRYEQRVNLTSGTYLLSWYQRDREDPLPPTSPEAPSAVAPLNVRVEDWKGRPITTTAQTPIESERWLNPDWRRHWVTVEVREGTDAVIAWEVPAASAATGGVLFAAPQLELISSTESISPSALFPTDDDYLIPAGVCDDKDGSRFRAKYWGYGCEHYCPPELGSKCVEISSDPSKLPTRCFYEMKFNLSQGRLEKGGQVTQGGFSAGNFNYRFEDIAVNVVGTSVKDCENSEIPSSCYANNFLQYTLRQDGPFVVRNYLGREYEAPLYPGRIQQGKALLAERYLTNPLSSADEQLLKRYWDSEFVGRPLDGAYTLRIYDTAELNWDALEDVQLLVNYRYWTRLN